MKIFTGKSLDLRIRDLAMAISAFVLDGRLKIKDNKEISILIIFNKIYLRSFRRSYGQEVLPLVSPFHNLLPESQVVQAVL